MKSQNDIDYGKEAISLLRELTKSYEFYLAMHIEKELWDEYDTMMYPIWIRVAELLDETSK